MRIVGGSLKGRRFSPPKQFRARPTTDTAREALFNILTNHIDFEESSVIDLFAGTGAISLEFASRGVRQITSVEKDFHHFSFIRKCVAELGLEETISIVKSDVFNFLKHKGVAPASLIFADPPFDMPSFETILAAILDSGLLLPDGLLIIEHSSKNDFSGHHEFISLRKYGKVHFSFFGTM